MFEKANEMLSDALNDLKISIYEKSHPVDNISKDDFDNEFYDWTQISATYSSGGGYFFNYK